MRQFFESKGTTLTKEVIIKQFQELYNSMPDNLSSRIVINLEEAKRREYLMTKQRFD